MITVLEMTMDELADAVANTGAEGYRAKQIADWVYRKGVTNPAGMKNLPTDLRRQLTVTTSRVIAADTSPDETVKLLVELADGERIEAVMIPSGRRSTACVSTQVGCAMGCAFCASGGDGLKRNLSAAEIIEQVLHLWQQTHRRITHVVFMGMGEPLANYDATVAAVRALVDPDRFGISARHITISTVGLPKQIRRLAGEDLPVTLAISLHAPNDALRRKLIPAAAGASLEEIIAAAETFFASRGREVTLEYILIKDVNDTNVCAEALAGIANRLRCNVNLIRYNAVAGLPHEPPTAAAASDFVQRLRRRGANVQLRRSRGKQVNAACGQLRRQHRT